MLLRSKCVRMPVHCRRAAALLLTMAFTAICLAAPSGEFRTVYADSLLITITSQPESVTANPGETVTFSVTATGSDLSYQWYFKKYGEKNWTLWSGHTSSTASVVIDDSWNLAEVYCKISGRTGGMADSDSAVIRVKKPLAILSQPQDITVKTGEKVRFSVSAQGSGDLRYQWYCRPQGRNAWLIWDGQTKAETDAIAEAEWNKMQVYCKITDSTGRNVRSNAATLSVIQPVKFITPPESVTAREGENIRFTVLAQGTGNITYQWFIRKPGSKSWVVWKGYTSPVINLKAEMTLNGVEVYCRATDSRGAKTNSVSASITVAPELKITVQPADGTYSVGEKAQFSVEAKGYGSLQYQWYYRKAGNSEWTCWKGKTFSMISAQADCTWHFMEVYCQVTDGVGQSLDSSKAIITITKKSDKRYIKRTFTVKADKTRIYNAPGTSNTCIGTLQSGESYLALEWGCDSSDATWYRFDWNGKNAWISRSKTTVSDEFVTIPNRSFKGGGMPVIYLSPSRQTKNEYAAGSTTEGIEMNRVGDELKKILVEEYWCVVHMPPIQMPISLCRRPLDAYNKDADIYLAIHSNAHSSKVRYGAVGYYFPGSEQSRQLGENMADEMAKISPFTPNVGSKTVNGMKGFDNVGYAEVRDPAYFGMISLLAEVEYHDNADSAQWIIDHPKEIARALANALEKTFDIQKR